MKEVEVKINITNPEQIIQILQNQGCVFSDPITQRDMVYIPNQVPTVPTPPGTNVLRIRKQDNKNIFTLKRSDEHNHLSKLEHELSIDNADEMEKIIQLLGFKLIADTTKTRRKCKIQGYEICIDEVNELGNFLEIEKMTEEDPALAQQEMLAFLSSLGVDTSKRMAYGYDVLYVHRNEPGYL